MYTRNGLHWVVSSHYRTDGLSQRKSKPEAKDAALTLVTDVKQAVETVQAAKGAAEVIFVTSAWGWMSETWTSLHIA